MASTAVDTRPTWRKVVDFPLVTLILAILVFAVTLSLSVLIAKQFSDPTGDHQMVWKLIFAAMLIVVYKLVIARMGKIKRDDLRLAGWGRDLSVGLGVGAGIMFGIAAVTAVLNIYSVAGPGDTVNFLPEIISLGIFPAISEEILFRGILFRWIEELAGSWFALAFTAGLFGLAHFYNPNATAFSSFAIAIEAGILLGGTYMLTRSLWLPIGLHASWNITQGEILDVPVSGLPMEGLVNARIQGPELLSGGQFGFEASIIALVLATAVGIWFLLRAVREGQVMRPWWVRRRLAAERGSEETVRVDVDADADLRAPVDRA